VVAALSDVSSDGRSSSNVEVLVFGRSASMTIAVTSPKPACELSNYPGRMLGTRQARTHHEELQHVLDRDGKLEGDDDEVTTQSTTVPDPLREMTAWHDVPALAIT
jgi:hypothetical protein